LEAEREVEVSTPLTPSRYASLAGSLPIVDLSDIYLDVGITNNGQFGKNYI
jgi:hypothetical protein